MKNLNITKLVEALKGKQRELAIKELSIVQFPIEHGMMTVRVDKGWKDIVFITTNWVDSGKVERCVEITKRGKTTIERI